MNREKLFKNLEKRYTSKRDMISRIPLGVNPDSLWQELLNLRRSSSTVQKRCLKMKRNTTHMPSRCR